MLSQPMEILELQDGEATSFKVKDWQLEDAIIRPAHAPGGKAIKVLRIFVGKEQKPTFPHYWDITGAGAVAQLLPVLQAPGYQQKTFTLKAEGEGVRKRFSLEVQ